MSQRNYRLIYDLLIRRDFAFFDCFFVGSNFVLLIFLFYVKYSFVIKGLIAIIMITTPFGGLDGSVI